MSQWRIPPSRAKSTSDTTSVISGREEEAGDDPRQEKRLDGQPPARRGDQVDGARRDQRAGERGDREPDRRGERALEPPELARAPRPAPRRRPRPAPPGPPAGSASAPGTPPPRRPARPPRARPAGRAGAGAPAPPWPPAPSAPVPRAPRRRRPGRGRGPGREPEEAGETEPRRHDAGGEPDAALGDHGTRSGWSARASARSASIIRGPGRCTRSPSTAVHPALPDRGDRREPLPPAQELLDAVACP